MMKKTKARPPLLIDLRVFAIIFTMLWILPAQADELEELKALVKEQSTLIEGLVLRVEVLESREAELRERLSSAAETIPSSEVLELPPSAEGNLLATSEISPKSATVPAAGETTPPPDTTGNVLDKVVTRGDFPRSFKIPGTEVSIQVDGYVKFDLFHDDAVVLGGARLLPDTIAVGSETLGTTNFSVEQSRISLFAQGPTPHGRISGFVEVDFFGSGGPGAQSARLRHAYGRFGPLLAGQTWSTFMDPYALPQTVALTAPSGSIFKRQPQIRWTQSVGEGKQVSVAFERSNQDFAVLAGNERLARRPDFVATWRHALGRGHYQIGGILRSLETRDAAGHKDDVTGWGINVTGRVKIGATDSLMGGVVFGEGVGNYLTGFASSPAAAAQTSTGSFESLSASGGYIGYQHWWASEFKSNFVLSQVELDNLPDQPGSFVRSTQVSGLNLIWAPRPGFGLGLEYSLSKRENKDREERENNRFQFAIQFGF